SDEVELAEAAGVEDPIGYETVTLTNRTPVAQALAQALHQIGERLNPGPRVSYDDGALITPNAYVSTLQLGATLPQILLAGLPNARLEPAASLFREMQGHKTEAEIELIHAACRIGEAGFAAARLTMAPGRTEYEVAGAVVDALTASAGDWWHRRQGSQDGSLPAGHAGGAWVMSGPNSALAYRAFAATGTRRLKRGDFVLVHMNPQVGGFWSDLTRTFVLGEPDPQHRTILEAVLQARADSRPAVHSGATGRDVDAAARAVLVERGFGEAFKHGLGHGIGFNGISAEDLPSLHPLSEDHLAAEMCFNIEPAVYIDGLGGCRHCDAIALTSRGTQELSPFFATLDELVVSI
ncbi:MAG: M24 family metallopeptidase, partial [Dehalococcoidia bacterium]